MVHASPVCLPGVTYSQVEHNCDWVGFTQVCLNYLPWISAKLFGQMDPVMSVVNLERIIFHVSELGEGYRQGGE